MISRASNYLWLFPLVAGTAWFITLTTLFFAWISNGKPTYPQQSNPWVPFISDIGAHVLQPLFITGAAMTGLFYAATVIAVHWARYSPRFLYSLSDDKIWRKSLSVLAALAGLLASLSLILLSIYDNESYHVRHRMLLLTSMAGLAASAVGTTVVWWDQTWRASDFKNLRRWCLVSNAIVIAEISLGAAFTGSMYTKHMRIAGILEWVLTVLGCGYLSSFIGYLWVPRALAHRSMDEEQDSERRPLLDSRR